MISTDLIAPSKNRWQNVYWYSRALVNSTKYVNFSPETRLLTSMVSSFHALAKNNGNSKTALRLQKLTLYNLIEQRFINSTTRVDKVHRLLEDLDAAIKSIADMEVFIFTCEHIMIPLNKALSNIPVDESELTLAIFKSYLQVNGEDGIVTVVNNWTDIGERVCLTAERKEIIKAITILGTYLDKAKNMSPESNVTITSGFAQEFERRASQKRKVRVSHVVDTTRFVLEYFKIITKRIPKEKKINMPIDNWIQTKDGSIIGIAINRSIHENGMKMDGVDYEDYFKLKIKNIYQVLTDGEDSLSDERIKQLGVKKHIFYFPDKSSTLLRLLNDESTKNYVRPMSKFIADVRKDNHKINFLFPSYWFID